MCQDMVKEGRVRGHTAPPQHHPFSLQPRQVLLDLPSPSIKTGIFGQIGQDRGGQVPGQTLTENLKDPKASLGIVTVHASLY